MTTVSEQAPADDADILDRIRSRIGDALNHVGELTDLALQTMQQLKRPIERDLLVAQLEQIGALRALATNPVRKLVVPRVLATTIMFPLLTVVSMALGILGGLVIAVINLHVTANFYMRSVITTVKYNDLSSGIGKTFFFGFTIALIGCYNGLRTSGGADGVGRSTTRTVVTGAITVLIMDFFLTKLFLLIL